MLMKTKSISDGTLLLVTGFCSPVGYDAARLALFCGVSERTAYRWIKHGLPERARHLLSCLFIGDFLPVEWRRLGMQVASDGLHLQSGHFIPLKALTRWPFIASACDWSKVPL